MDKNSRQQSANVAAAASRALPISTLRDGPASRAGSSSAPSAAAAAAAGTGGNSQEVKKSSRERRKAELERSMLITKVSTASLGKYDEKIAGEPKAKGMKRKFEPTVSDDFAGEKASALDVLKRVESGVGKVKKAKKGGQGEEGGLNVRKAVRFAGKQERMGGGKGQKGKRRS